MARLVVEGEVLVVRLSWLERLGALAIAPTAPLTAIQSVRTAEDPWRELRGLRAPGTGIPGVIMLGTLRARGIRDFAAVYRRRPGVVVDLAGTRYTRFVVSCRDEAPADVVAAITAVRP